MLFFTAVFQTYTDLGSFSSPTAAGAARFDMGWTAAAGSGVRPSGSGVLNVARSCSESEVDVS